MPQDGEERRAARCEECRTINEDLPHQATRTLGGRHQLLHSRCKRCGGPLQPRNCQEHPYGSHDDYWHGFECTVPKPWRKKEG